MSIKGAGAHQSFIFGQVIEIEKLAGQFYKIIGQNQPVCKFINSQQNKDKYHVKYIYFYNIKFTKYMKFTKFTTLLYKNTVNINF